MNNPLVLPLTYFGNIRYFQFLLSGKPIQFETKEHFVKQTYRNRCEIYGANGLLKLIVPLKKWSNHTPIEEIQISYDSDWQKQHWRSLESAYRSSPFFEYYEDDIKQLYLGDQSDYLIEFNLKSQNTILELLNETVEWNNTNEYDAAHKRFIDELADPKYRTKNKLPKYIQVFSESQNFIENLSIVDLLFNLGPEAINYLKANT